MTRGEAYLLHCKIRKMRDEMWMAENCDSYCAMFDEIGELVKYLTDWTDSTDSIGEVPVSEGLPDTKERTMNRYVYADAFLKSVKQKAYPQSGIINESERKISLFGIMEILTAMPIPDVVEVIRCEHCLHWDDEIKDGVYVGPFYHCCDYNGENKDPCDFCSDAERRIDE